MSIEKSENQKAWSFQKRHLILLYLAAIVGASISFSSLYLYLHFNDIFDNLLRKKLEIKPNSFLFNKWKEPNNNRELLIYLFNITNTPIESNEKPSLRTIGPYTYKKLVIKFNISWSKDGESLTYYEKNVYVFLREKSIGDPLKDVVHGISLTPAILAVSLKNILAKSALYNFAKAVTKQTVHEYIWGYEDNLLLLSNLLGFKKQRVGVMVGRNNSVVGPFKLNTGYKDSSQLMQVMEFDNKSKLTTWSSEEANEIKGTNDFILSSGINLNDSKYFFSNNLCRTIKLIPVLVTSSKSFPQLQLYSLKAAKTVYESAEHNPQNQGYCVKKTPGPKCPLAGLLDLSSCIKIGNYRAPFYASNPYFHGADSKLRQQFKSWHKVELEANESTFNVEPKTGLILEAYIEIQLSTLIYGRKNYWKNYIKFCEEDTYVPFVLMTEVTIASREIARKMFWMIYQLPLITKISLLIGAFMFSFIFILSTSCILIKYFGKYSPTSRQAHEDYITSNLKQQSGSTGINEILAGFFN